MIYPNEFTALIEVSDELLRRPSFDVQSMVRRELAHCLANKLYEAIELEAHQNPLQQITTFSATTCTVPKKLLNDYVMAQANRIVTGMATIKF